MRPDGLDRLRSDKLEPGGGRVNEGYVDGRHRFRRNDGLRRP